MVAWGWEEGAVKDKRGKREGIQEGMRKALGGDGYIILIMVVACFQV